MGEHEEDGVADEVHVGKYEVTRGGCRHAVSEQRLRVGEYRVQGRTGRRAETPPRPIFLS
jgi:hypothetical protein